jgi:hypothetical protein
VSQLPDKLSALIRVALADLRKVEADSRYVVNMHRWHKPVGEVCQVCLAGAVMAQSLGIDPERHVEWPTNLATGGAEAKMLALDCARQGDVLNALYELDVDAEEAWDGLSNEDAPRYQDDPEAFYAYMEDLANRLEEKGL